ncbi:hypothetical protein ACEQ8H_004892 [Pleosporales sp. CAS-2024a]
MGPPCQGKIYIEARKLPGIDDGFGSNSIGALIRRHVAFCYKELHIGQRISLNSTLEALVALIEVKGHSSSQATWEAPAYLLSDNDLDIAVYAVNESEEYHGIADSESPFHTVPLPHAMFVGLWESLKFKGPIGDEILNVLAAAIRKWHDDSTALTSSWFNTVLLHGPPGSGKTSLAHGLAQRLSIRLSDIYTGAKLIQVNGNGMFSHMYGGTSKAISSCFSAIHGMASSDAEDAQLLIVVMDEIDKLVPCRGSVSKKQEPLDTMRATAEVLTGLDQLRCSINIVWIFTTNLVQELDPAFVDRCLFRKAVNAPESDCIYEMLRMDIDARIQRGEISRTGMPSDQPSATVEPMSSDASATQWLVLREIAHLCAGLSARHLRGLLDIALVKGEVHSQTELQGVLSTLKALVQDEVGACQEDGSAGRAEAVTEEDVDLPTEGLQDDGPGPLPIDVNVYSSDV